LNQVTSDIKEQVLIKPNGNSEMFKRVNMLLRSVTNYQPYDLSIIIENYRDNIINHYQNSISEDVEFLCKNAQIPYAFDFEHFGILISFKNACQLDLHNEEMHLNEVIKKLVKTFGVVVFRNASLTASIKNLYHLNNFPHLNFHRDRGESHENRYSLYTRDPDDMHQKFPRKASTIFIDNAVAYLQAYLENMIKPNETGRRGHYSIFHNDGEELELFGDVILEQRWSAPIGMGEICIINNNSVLHSSYKHGLDPGYRIGARYLF